MIRSKLLIAGAAFGAIAALYRRFTAGTGRKLRACDRQRARGLSEAAATKRSDKNLNAHINHWAHKGKLKAVRVGTAATAAARARTLRLHELGEGLPIGSIAAFKGR